MKKILSFMIVVVLVAVFLIGCNETTVTCENLSENINMKLDRLTQTVTKLDTIDNQYIANPDIFPNHSVVSYIVPNPQKPEIYNPEKTITEPNKIVRRIIASTLDTNDIIEDLLIEKLHDNLKQDEKGNCYICGNSYTDNDNNHCCDCNSMIMCDENGNCTYCNNCLQLDESGKCLSCENYCIDGNCNKVNNFLEFNSTSKNCADKYSNLLEENTVVENIALTTESEENLPDSQEAENNITDSEDFVEDETQTSNKPQIYYYYEEYNLSPENIKYKPRYISNESIEDTQTNLNNYVIKIQKLYAMTADVIEANNTLSDYKENLLNTIQDTKNINASYRNIKSNPSQHQIQAIKNYLYDIDTTTRHIRQANGDLNNEINNINKTNNLGITSSIDVMNSNYLRILNHLDTRITYHELALSTLDQLKIYLLENIEAYQQDSNILDNTTTEDILPETTTDENLDNSDDIIVTDQEENIDTETNQNDINDNIDNNEETLANEEENEENTDETSDIIEESYNDENNDNDNNNEDAIINDNTTSSNIDTYLDDSSNNDLIIENIEEDDIANNNSNNSDIINNNYSYNNTNTGINNPTHNSNRIINENNLNTDNNRMNGNNYLYDSNGNLYNTNTNVLDNSGRHNNVNTYEYNTLLDSLNQGTIDNGINNL